ncbi:hypothetical protein PV08_07912 [Exophiala spinifera]|uniref:C6 transcription factor RegA n=1 Tax=Exophiala spinifera TaxID=91928 RepID=A0A0D2B8Z1_9EURO|nr:uncharacterized protein PV08_07912 [Exophiala spinifera]KIW15125.1 hypothetical protein PV08_07912 [Exophiala spinifera]
MSLQTPVGIYHCGMCKAEYTRVDHLVRHVRGHTKQRPFVCTICSKGFGRQDLVKRHMLLHSEWDDLSPTTGDGKPRQTRRNGHRVHQACRLCAVSKLKCTDEKPCKRCLEKNLFCEYDQDSNVMDVEAGSASGAQPWARNDATLTEKDHQLDQTMRQGVTPDSNHGIAAADPQSAHVTAHQGNAMIELQNGILPDVLGGTMNIADLDEYITFDFNPVLDEVEFSFLNDSNVSPAEAPVPISPASNRSADSSTMGVGSEVYRMSTSLNGWAPDKDGISVMEHQNLILPIHVSPIRLPALSRFRSVFKKDLSGAMRDRILTMILRTSPRRTLDSIIGSFPSLETLQNLIHYALLHMTERQVVPFVHLPSFAINQQRPELLCALVAYGSVWSPSIVVRKFGYAVQEAVRMSVNQRLEEEPTAFRDLGIIQAFYIQLYLGYYSGVARKIETAEANSMLGTTMLRRGQMLRAELYQPPQAFLDVAGLSLREKWLRWVESEARKRLVYFAMAMDAHVSISRRINVLFPYAEIETPLPATSKLWEADTPTLWHEVLSREVVLSKEQALCLRSILRQPHAVEESYGLCDENSLAFIVFSGFWALIQEYRQMESILSKAQNDNDFVINSRYSELSTTLDQLKAELSDTHSLCPRTTIIQELISLHLNASFYDLSDYTGRRTAQDAQSAMPYVLRWYQSPQSRMALWHAGQIFKAVHLLDPETLVDIYAIALYQAAVILWLWGLMRKGQATSADPSATTVVMDGDESPAVLRFFKTPRGVPVLTGKAGRLIPLHEPAMVVDLVGDLVLEKWPSGRLPLTTEEVLRLMRGFSSISRDTARV